MTVRKMIELLQVCDPEDEVRLHHHNGDTPLIVYELSNQQEHYGVIIETEDDFDVSEELACMIDYFNEEGWDELDAYMEMLERGYNLDLVQKYIPERYEHIKEFCEEHGLV